jgi:hypothetical protein
MSIEQLPPTPEKWLRDCGICGWLLDLKTGEVHLNDGTTWPSLLALANHWGFSRRNETRGGDA